MLIIKLIKLRVFTGFMVVLLGLTGVTCCAEFDEGGIEARKAVQATIVDGDAAMGGLYSAVLPGEKGGYGVIAAGTYYGVN